MTKVKMRTKGYCPNCETERDIERIETVEMVRVRGEDIRVEAIYWRCLACGEEFEGPGGTHDEVAAAYRLYRAKKGLMQPEEIKALREEYELTQSDLTQILGFGAVTLSRYENGMLQSAAHDWMLQTIRDPRAFWTMLNRVGDRTPLSQEKLVGLRDKLRKMISSGAVLDPILEAALSYEADDRSGHQRFNLKKLTNAILFFCQPPQWKTKINKLLFYADFLHFRDYSCSITGARYAHAPYGPCPDKFEHLFGWLAEQRVLQIDEVTFGNYAGEKIRTLEPPDLSIFSASEIQVLTFVRGRLRRKNAQTLTDLSHREKGFRETKDGDLISYSFAQDLRI